MLSAGGPPDEAPAGHAPGHTHAAAEGEVAAAVAAAGGSGPLRLVGLAVVLLVVGFVLRWGQDVTAPYVNVGEADMASAVAFTSDGGTYRVVSSGPSRPELRFTVCEATGAEGFTERVRGGDGSRGGHVRLGVTRVTRFDLPPGPAEIRCGNLAPDRGAGSGRFQVVDGDGPLSLVVVGLLASGAACAVGGIGWYLLRLRRATAARS